MTLSPDTRYWLGWVTLGAIFTAIFWTVGFFVIRAAVAAGR